MFTQHMREQAAYLASLGYQIRYFDGANSHRGHRLKEAWLKTGVSVLRAIGKELEFNVAKVYKTKGGFGVSGESNLMGMWHHRNIGIYITTASLGHLYNNMDSRSDGPYFMWRTIKHMTDYGGSGGNQWEPYDSFMDLDALIELFNKVGVPEVL